MKALRRYPEYRPSGLRWLGEIPAHWEVKAARREYDMQLGKMLQPTPNGPQDSEIPYFKAQHVQWEAVRTTEIPYMWANPFDEVQYGVLDGDLLVCEGGEVGRAGIVRNPPNRAIIQNALHRVRSFGTSDIRLLMYLLKHIASQGWFDILCNRATIAHFTSEKFGDLPIPVPPHPEQGPIAAFLDRETARIDAFVAKKERLIELLQEKRTALISHVVTKGLDPDAPMKDSGVDWLGEIPAHWEVRPLKRWVSLIQTGSTPPTRERHYYEESTVPWHGPSSFSHDLLLHPSARKINGRAIRDGVARLFDEESSMIVTIGATIGKVGFVGEPSSCNQQITSVTFNATRVFPKYGAYRLKRMEPMLRGIAPNTTLPILDQVQVGYLPFAAPSKREQRAIAAFLDRETGQIDALVAKVREVINRLKELRMALISAAVTGKIDVREAAA